MPDQARARNDPSANAGQRVITSIDHIVLTVKSIEETLKFYTRCLGMAEVTFGKGRKALVFGRHTTSIAD
jgi:catechol-2,3-dioxygenase